jgi:hypothetical protein
MAIDRIPSPLKAWILGVIVYLIASLSVFDGLLSLIFQPVAAIFWSGWTVVIASVAGLVFRIPALGRAWNSTRTWAGLIAAGSLAALILAHEFNQTITYQDAFEGAEYTVLKPTYAAVNYFLLLFAITNWPTEP